MLDSIRKFPEQLNEEPVEVKLKQGFRPKKIVMVGMGGSGIACSFFNELFDIKVPCHVIKDYGISTPIDEGTLILLVSYSGDTEEVLHALKQAEASKCRIVAVTTGGKLKELCKKHDVVLIKEGIVPRLAFPFFIKALYTVLAHFSLIEPYDWKKLAHSLDMVALQVEGKGIAANIGFSVPVIYGYGYPMVLDRIRNQFNENSKMPCHTASFPALNHNEIAAWVNEKAARHFCVAFLEYGDEPQLVKERMQLTRGVINKRVKCIGVKVSGKDRVERALRMILLFDFASVYVAQRHHMDTSDVEVIREFKARL